MKNRLIKSCIWSVALYGSETWTLGKNEERIINAFETRFWRRMLKKKYLIPPNVIKTGMCFTF